MCTSMILGLGCFWRPTWLAGDVPKTLKNEQLTPIGN